jgi:hypothetical protein
LRWLTKAFKGKAKLVEGSEKTYCVATEDAKYQGSPYPKTKEAKASAVVAFAQAMGQIEELAKFKKHQLKNLPQTPFFFLNEYARAIGAELKLSVEGTFPFFRRAFPSSLLSKHYYFLGDSAVLELKKDGTSLQVAKKRLETNDKKYHKHKLAIAILMQQARCDPLALEAFSKIGTDTLVFSEIFKKVGSSFLA